MSVPLDRIPAAYRDWIRSAEFRTAFDRAHGRPMKRYLVAIALLFTIYGIPIALGLFWRWSRASARIRALYREEVAFAESCRALIVLPIMINSAFVRGELDTA